VPPPARQKVTVAQSSTNRPVAPGTTPSRPPRRANLAGHERRHRREEPPQGQRDHDQKQDIPPPSAASCQPRRLGREQTTLILRASDSNMAQAA